MSNVDELVEEVARVIDWEVFSLPDSSPLPTRHRKRVARDKAKAAIKATLEGIWDMELTEVYTGDSFGNGAELKRYNCTPFCDALLKQLED